MWLQPQLLLLTTVAILANCKNKNNFIKLDSFQRSLLQNEKELARKISQRSIVAAADKASQSERVGKQGFITIELKKKSILLGEVIAILSAYLFPHIGCSGGLLRSDIVVSKIGIFVLFVIKGLSISPGEAEKAWADWRINLFTQMFSSIAVPLLIWGIVSPSVPDRGFRDGLICLSALPCALNTAVSLAAAAGANTPTALTNGLLGWLLSIAVMPATVAWLLREDSMSSDAITCNIRLIAVTIGKFVILPCVLGQMARRIPQLKNFISKHTDLRSTFSDMILYV
jgi:predicted Na+-dependent transporter